MILQNICSVINSTEICRNTVILWCMGVVKTKKIVVFYQIIHSRLFYTPTLKIYLLLITRNPIKIRQICHSDKIYPISYPISLKPTKIKHFSHFTTQKSNFHLTKNSLIISKLSLFISTFTDNDFPRKIPNHIPYIRGYHKTTHKIVKTVIALFYFLRKNKIKQRIYN